MRPNVLTAWAPAKVNLYLHVGSSGPGGLHPLDSLVMFADSRAADRISAKPSPHLALRVEGPGARLLKTAPNNLALAAALGLREACAHTGLGAELILQKHLPIAGGVGGGSADAAATLLLLNEMWDVNFGEAALERLAEQLGSDVPACVRGRPLVMRGTGERLMDIAAPGLPVVLVNPGVALETRRVFERYDGMGADPRFAERPPPEASDIESFAAGLREYRNDLEPAALAICPEIGKVLERLRQEPGCLLARLSGSGPTCFGIFRTNAEAEAASASLSGRYRKYWVQATELRGAEPIPADD